MANKRRVLAIGMGAGSFLGSVPSMTIAAESMHHAQSGVTSDLPAIEQPLSLKAGVTLGGFGLIGLELWWFLLSKTRPSQTKIDP